jgi:superfamily I DNA and RNA helicase
LLRALGSRKRAIICGGAGTGKTLLALERARELAAQGLKTLLVCYNRPLADYLKSVAQGADNLHAMTFHQLCEWRIAVARTEIGKDFLEDATTAYPQGDRFKLHLPFALALATEATDLRYDAIIVDEAQDFAAEFWFGLDALLANATESWLYVFHDHNQAIYADASKPPINEAPFILTSNCRNTSIIHASAYRYYSGPDTDAPSIAGTELVLMTISNEPKRIAAIQALVSKLISEEGVSPTDIAVLAVRGGSPLLYNALAAHHLPRGTNWAIQQHRIDGTVVIDTVSRFKGLEAAIIILCNFEDADPQIDRELFYVGLSRAKSRIYLVGSASAIEIVRRGPPSIELSAR